MVRQHEEKFENLPEDFQLTKVCGGGSFKRNVSRGQFFITIPDVQMAGYSSTSSCREYTHPRSDNRSQPKGFVRGNTKIGPELEIKTTKEFDRHGIDTKIDSKQKEETQSWRLSAGALTKT